MAAANESLDGNHLKPGWYGLFRFHKIKRGGAFEYLQTPPQSLSTRQVSFDSSWTDGNFEGIVHSSDVPRGFNSDLNIQLDKDWYYVVGD